ncbi:hypothetical protein DFH09DRAFT_1100090 [Mycena vulgaris]|nr:hypothetical protein DFH09DRAFT_1100090 [Mycena vulgaris]
MDKDLVSVSENLHGSFVYQMERGGKVHLGKQGPQSRKRLSRETRPQCNSTIPSPCFFTGTRIPVTCSFDLMSCSNTLAPIPQAVPNHGSIEAHRKDKIPGAIFMPNRWKVGNGAHNGVGVAEDVVEFGLERLGGRADVCTKALC